MKDTANETYRERYAVFLLRWAKINSALPKYYATLAQDRLRNRGCLGITYQHLYGFKNSGNMPDNPVVIEVMEELAKEYHPDKVRSEKDARKFLRTWEPRPGRKVKAAQLAAA